MHFKVIRIFLSLRLSEFDVMYKF